MDSEFSRYLQRMRAHRAELRDAVAAVDDALASPIARPAWRDRVRTALVELCHDFRTHIELTEGEGASTPTCARRHRGCRDGCGG